MLHYLNRLLNKDIIPNRFMPALQLLIGINIIVFILQILNPDMIMDFVHRSNDPLSYITSIFMHGDIGHIMGNMLMLSFIGPVIERAYGSFFTFISFLFLGICGAALSAFLTPEAMGIGASGSICGFTGLWVFHHALRGRFILIFPALFYIIMQGIQGGISAIIPTGTGHIVHFGSAMGSIMLLPQLFKRI